MFNPFVLLLAVVQFLAATYYWVKGAPALGFVQFFIGCASVSFLFIRNGRM